MSRAATAARTRPVAAVTRLAQEFAARRPIRCPSLIVTLFGDVVEPHGGVIWLGSMVEALGLLGLDERLVRTSTFRLVQDGWLEATRDGRRSYYRFTAYGRAEYVRAARRIYAGHRPAWDGNWTLLLPVAVPEARREAFRRSVRWAGFGNLAPNLYAHPGADLAAAGELLAELDLGDKVVVMQATTDVLQSNRLLREVLWQNWQLGELEAAYARFVARFRPLRTALARVAATSPEQCLVARLLLVHEYRRVLLHDTDIPGQLLPRDWPGLEAHRLAAEIYHAVATGSVDFIRARLQGTSGLLPGAAASFSRRFGT
jgi:phenylacetic acid degradation operon negative regulatory protein